jgi:hypothetical protein
VAGRCGEREENESEGADQGPSGDARP